MQCKQRNRSMKNDMFVRVYMCLLIFSYVCLHVYEFVQMSEHAHENVHINGVKVMLSNMLACVRL